MGVVSGKRVWKRCLLGLVVFYFGWCLWPVTDVVRVYDDAGLSREQREKLIECGWDMSVFDRSMKWRLWRHSFFTPWRKGGFVMYVWGTSEEVSVRAGFYGGPLYAGGRGFVARWVNGEWVVDAGDGESGNALWTS